MEIQMDISTDPKQAPNGPTFDGEYSEDIKRQIVAMLIYDEAAWPALGPTVKPEFFENPVLADSVRLIQKFYERYQRRPSEDEFLQEITTFLENSKVPKPPEVYLEQVTDIMAKGFAPDFAYVRDEVAKFARFQATKGAFLKGIDHLRTDRDYVAIKAEIDSAISIGTSAGDLDVLDLADVERKEIEWFWHNKIPRAKLSLIVGDPGTRKSWFTMYLAACVTTGVQLPHSAHQTEQGRVVILSAEDDVEDTIVPRLEDCGGDKALAHVIRGTKQGKMFNLAEDLDRLRAYLQAKSGVRLIIIDPISAYIGAGTKVNSHKDTDVRGILSPAVKLAKDFDVTVIGIMHLNKSQDLGAMYRVSGSMAFVAAARAVWLMTQEDREGEDKSLHYFSRIKVNNAPASDGLVWKIRDDSGGLEFLEPTFQPPPVQEQLGPRQPKRPSKLDEAMRWLHDLLKDGQAMEQAEIVGLAMAEGISRTTLDRAKKELGVKSEKMPGGSSPWTWVLPKPTPEN
jgi:putative DNA primase/helicase